MRILYVAPRYHTNQVPVMKGWICNGHQVMFISQFAGTSEDYTVINPVLLGYSRLFEIYASIYRFLLCRKEKSNTKEYNFRTKMGFPPFGKAKNYIQEFRPDLVIVRERSVYNVPFVQVCKKKKIPCILYNQSPLWDRKSRDNGWKRRFLLSFLPEGRITPVLGREEQGKVKMPGTYYVPFIIEPCVAPEEKKIFLNDRINLLCVARYEERKNLFLLADVFNDLHHKYNIHLTIIGEALDKGQIEYYRKLEQSVKENHLEDHIVLLQNLHRDQVFEAYRKSDLFILPSTRERASVSQLEAMSCSLPVICSDTNGSACYVENGKNGYLFRDNDRQDLTDKIEKIISDKSKLLKMGQKSYELVVTKYQFATYYEKLTGIMNRMTGARK